MNGLWRGGMLTVVLAIFPPALPVLALPHVDLGRVVVVANSGNPDSLALARYYMERRSIPEANLIALELSEEETVSWETFRASLQDPLLGRLVELGLMDGERLKSAGRDGHPQWRIQQNRVEYLVLCRGVPLRIEHSPALLEEESIPDLPSRFRTTRGSVDSELAGLPQTESPASGYVRNPLFSRKDAGEEDRRAVIRVGRLDAPSFEACRRMIDAALEAEEYGLRGRAYVDMGGPHSRGDAWLAAAAGMLRRLGFGAEEESTERVYDSRDRFDAPAFYFGWYRRNIEGVFRESGLRVPPGAIAIHIHSFSASTLRSQSRGWAGPLAELGFTATVGNVYEPYLELTHLPPLLLAGLAEGMTWGEAALFSVPVLSWQWVVLGDPLYRPFSRSLEEQLAGEARPGDTWQQYAVIRAVHLLMQEGKTEQALGVGEHFFFRHPDLPLALDLARLAIRMGEEQRAGVLLRATARARPHGFQELGVAARLAETMEEQGMLKEALELMGAILNQPDLSPDFGRYAYALGVRIARRNADMDRVLKWSSELSSLSPGK